MFRFEPGSYNTPSGFKPALACYKIAKNKKDKIDYILMNNNAIGLNEQMAVLSAEESLNRAFQKKQKTGNNEDIATSLKEDGFVKVDNPTILK
jgi:hypothetical protein